MTTPTFAPSINPGFVVPIDEEYRLDEGSVPKGYDIERPMGIRTLQRYAVTWPAVSRNQLDEILSFFDGLNGATGRFFWTPLDNVRSPNGMTPLLGEVAGGSLVSQGTYYVQFTWYQTSGGLETLGSKEASFAVQDNFLLTVDVPVFPLGVTEWRVYVGISSGDAELQSGTETTRRWTMPAGGRDAGGANPPATNNLVVALLWKLEGARRIRKIAANRFSLSLVLKEQIADG